MINLSKRKYRLLVIAHPDDETIYFGGLLQRLRSLPWLIVLATDGNADGNGKKRKSDFQKALKRLKIKHSLLLNQPDIYEKRLNIKEISQALSLLPLPLEVYTHGILGEYGHPHHQDVSYAVSHTFKNKAPVYQVAYNTFPEKNIILSKSEFKIKNEILGNVYGSETKRFINLVPATFVEAFVKVSLEETNLIYKYWITGNRPLKSKLKKFKWLHDYFKTRKSHRSTRLF